MSLSRLKGSCMPESTDDSESHRPIGLLDLPAEMRAMIYSYLLPQGVVRPWQETDDYGPRFLHDVEPERWECPLLLVNRQLYTEVKAEFYRTVTWRTRNVACWHAAAFEESDYLSFRNLFGEIEASKFQHIHLDIEIELMSSIDAYIEQEDELREIVENLPRGLHTLSVELHVSTHFDPQEQNSYGPPLDTAIDLLCKSLRSIRNVHHCSLNAHWSISPVGHYQPNVALDGVPVATCLGLKRDVEELSRTTLPIERDPVLDLWDEFEALRRDVEFHSLREGSGHNFRTPSQKWHREIYWAPLREYETDLLRSRLMSDLHNMLSLVHEIVQDMRGKKHGALCHCSQAELHQNEAYILQLEVLIRHVAEENGVEIPGDWFTVSIEWPSDS
ncbi:MAG: hypothetical protein Q9157_006822 [Trypethelium eluteriae]